MENSKTLFYWVVWSCTKLIYPKIKLEGWENVPREPCILAGNHSQIHGPIIAELYIPEKREIWCAQEMMHLKEVPAYTYQDFWSRKPKQSKWFYRILSYLIAPLCVCVFNRADTIAVYRDGRVLSTFRETVDKLKGGSNIVIFPEHDIPHNHILCMFQPGFVDVAKSYYKQTGKCLPFVPMYLAPKLHTVYFGKPICFDPEASLRDERQRISRYLMEEITRIATALPYHKVIPYNNIPKKEYVYNRPLEVTSHEETGG